ncbi:MAG: hypothetical protein LPK45_01925 [Bacteroidota bacterium]|nr:hypothetical protein [Bacteroidota bacterium]MDX5429791.1 hypothetical protein [Bacteroidota bacterium]MDX5468570.1 hypothetical protein [Bacteroidota bacterium]
MKLVKYPLQLSLVLLWIGFVCAISFMEARLKFLAPGVTLEIGLGIGRIIFGALNKVEWTIAVLVLISILLAPGRIWTSQRAFYFLALTILLVQSFWLLPALDLRASQIIAHELTPPSMHHLYYIIAEGIKIVLLILFVVTSFNPLKSYINKHH